MRNAPVTRVSGQRDAQCHFPFPSETTVNVLGILSRRTEKHRVELDSRPTPWGDSRVVGQLDASDLV